MPVLAQPFGPIHEGYIANFTPDVSYVRQGKKVLFFRGKPELTESVEDGDTIVESIDDLEVVERDGKQYVKDGRWIVEGPYQRSDVENANGRTYSRRIWERIIGDPKSKFMQTVKAGGAIGHLEHPKDGRTDGNLGAIKHLDFKLKEDGVVWGKSELLDTPPGLILQEYTRKGVRWGVSSRGNGSVDARGKVNEADFSLETFDGVMRPSTPGAFPTQTSKVNSGVKEGEIDTVSNPDPKPAAPVNEAQAFYDESKALAETDLSKLDESREREIAGNLLKSIGRTNSLARSGQLEANKANDLRDWLTAKLTEIYYRGSARPPKAATTVTESEEDKPADPKDAAFRRVVSSLQERVNDATNEAARLRDELDAATARAEEAEANLARETKLKQQALEQMASVGIELGEAKRQLAVAADYIENLTSDEVEDPVAAQVESVLAEHEELTPFQNVLAKCESVEQVNDLAARLTRPATEEAPRARASDRTSLPTGRVVSESVQTRNKVAVKNNRSLATAAAVVTRMQPAGAKS